MKPRQPEKMPRKRMAPPKSHKLKTLRGYEYRTKLFGLRILQRICNRAGVKFLPYRLYRVPDEFSITHFANPAKGRLIIRTDPIASDHTQYQWEWKNRSKRFNFSLEQQSPIESEAFVRRFMQGILKSNIFAGYMHGCNFIVHKARPLEDFRQQFQINCVFPSNQVSISIRSNFNDLGILEIFRNENAIQINGQIKPNGKIYFPKSKALPSYLGKKLRKVIQEISDYAKKTGHQYFETSCVTYKDAPNEPEFYDLLLGKSNVY